LSRVSPRRSLAGGVVDDEDDDELDEFPAELRRLMEVEDTAAPRRALTALPDAPKICRPGGVPCRSSA
jgi:hypothetical protein